jgi:hypothetical protein
MMKTDKTVAYFYDENIGDFTYGGGNPMRPHRVRLTHSLVSNYGLADKLVIQRPTPRTAEELTQFHADGARAGPPAARHFPPFSIFFRCTRLCRSPAAAPAARPARRRRPASRAVGIPRRAWRAAGGGGAIPAGRAPRFPGGLPRKWECGAADSCAPGARRRPPPPRRD